MSSTIPAATTALYNLIAAAAADNTSALYGLQVTDGLPFRVEEQKLVAVLGFSSDDEEPITIGQYGHRQEVYDLTVAVKVHDPAQTVPASLRAEVFTYTEAVWQLVLDNVTLSGTVAKAEVVRRRSEHGIQAPTNEDGTIGAGYMMRVDLILKVTAFPE